MSSPGILASDSESASDSDPGASPSPSRKLAAVPDDLVVNIDLWRKHDFPLAVSACVVACSEGIKRAHLLDARIDGGLLLVRAAGRGLRLREHAFGCILLRLMSLPAATSTAPRSNWCFLLL